MRDAKKVTADYYWLITRGGNDIAGFERVKALAPNRELFVQYLREWKGSPASEWWAEYRRRFIVQLNDQPAKRYLRLLWQLVQSNHSVVLACFCADESRCHRRLVGDFLQHYGVEVVSYPENSEMLDTSEPRTQVVQQFSLFP